MSSASSETTGLRERKKEATRARLSAAAEDLLAEKGFHATTMDDIAAATEVSRATVFNYFPRKDEFLAAWVQRRREGVADLLSREELSGVHAADRLRHAFAELAKLLEKEAGRNRALVRAWVQAGGPHLPGAFQTARLFAETVRHGQHSGDLRDDVDHLAAGQAMFDVYLGVLLRWANDDPKPHRLGPPVARALELVLTGIALDRGNRAGRSGAA